MNKFDKKILEVNGTSELKSRGTKKVNDSEITEVQGLISGEDINQSYDDKFNKLKKQVIHFRFIDFIVFTFIILSVVLYVLSLEGCHETQTFCLVNLNPEFFHRIIIYLFICSFFISFILFFIIKGQIQFYHFIYGTLFYLYLTLVHDTGGDLSNHGSYNRTILLLLTILLLIFTSLLSCFIYCLKAKYFKSLFTLILIILLISFYLSYKISISCNSWDRGLNNIRINDDTSINKCQIIRPRNCWVEFLDGLLDISWMLNEDCNKFRSGERKELMKYILNPNLKNSNKIGFPITTNFKFLNESKFGEFSKNVMNNMIDIKDTNFTEEVILNFDNITNFGSIQFNIKKNETLIEERRELIRNELEKPIYQNILFIYIDSISRQHFIRKMKKTGAWIEKHMSKNKTMFNAYQFLKYQAFIFFTQLNTNPMFYGQSMYNKNGTHLIKHYKDKGFITAQSNNFCSRELFDIEDGYIENIQWEKFDHENIALFCDPNYFNPENPYTPYMGPYSIKKRCLYGKNTFEYVLEYGKLFWETYINERKFLRLSFQDAHEGTGEVVRYFDDHLVQFLDNFENKGWLNDTAIFFVSDHGNNMIGFYNIFNCEDFVLEKTLASLFIVLPKDKISDDINMILKKNEQTLVTPYDIYNTLINFVKLNHTSSFHSLYGNSFLTDINGKERDCDKYTLDLSHTWCRCKNN